MGKLYLSPSHARCICMEGCEYGDREMGCEVRPALDCYYPDLAAACCLTCSGLLMQNATPGICAVHTQPRHGPLSTTTRVSRYQKGKTNLDFTEARDSISCSGISWAVCKSAPWSRQITSCRPMDGTTFRALIVTPRWQHGGGVCGL